MQIVILVSEETLHCNERVLSEHSDELSHNNLDGSLDFFNPWKGSWEVFIFEQREEGNYNISLKEDFWLIESVWDHDEEAGHFSE